MRQHDAVDNAHYPRQTRMDKCRLVHHLNMSRKLYRLSSLRLGNLHTGRGNSDSFVAMFSVHSSRFLSGSRSSLNRELSAYSNDSSYSFESIPYSPFSSHFAYTAGFTRIGEELHHCPARDTSLPFLRLLSCRMVKLVFSAYKDDKIQEINLGSQISCLLLIDQDSVHHYSVLSCVSARYSYYTLFAVHNYGPVLFLET